MDRRSFIGSCSASAAAIGAAALPAVPVFAAESKPRQYERVLLVDEQRNPLKAAALKPLTNYVFHYPFEATPVFLLDLGKTVPPQAMSPRNTDPYAWPGGVGASHSIVAYSAICAHRLVYPTHDVSFISFRKTRAQRGVQDELIHCCSEHSQYDPAQGARVLSGPAPQPLCAVLLQHDPRSDTLTAYATLGPELFGEFFKKYAMKLSLDVGPGASNSVSGQSVVTELARFCKNTIQC